MMVVKRSIFAICLVLLLSTLLAGCNKITSASPDPSVDIIRAPGESVSLSVTGPVRYFYYQDVYERGMTECRWLLRFPQGPAEFIAVEEGEMFSFEMLNSITYTIPEDIEFNEISIACLYGYDGPNGWTSLDECTWTIRITHD